MNLRTQSKTWVSLAKQKAQAPPKPTSSTSALQKQKKDHRAEDELMNVPALHFRWPDDTIRRAPPGWHFPMTTSRAMWESWFQGCAEPRMGPFRLLKQRDLSTSSCRVQMSQARGVMKKLVDLAVSRGIASSGAELEEMPRFKCMAVFDQVYAILSTPEAEGILTEPLRADRTATSPYRHVYELLVKDKHKTGVDVNGNACAKDAAECTMVPWAFPSTTTKAMWLYWYKGDAANEIGPFRHLRSRDVERFANDRRQRKLLSSARVLMEHITEKALERGFVQSVEDLDGMDTTQLEHVFDNVFELVLDGGKGDGSGARLAKKAAKYTFTTVYHTMTTSTSKKRPRGDVI
ncbi:unnamed protein product [Aphanomyces euteiches]|uniref:Uncharacterized protein n=1 Tax=Aphanomyces euteiches TaxID=100861 RepID=A0A6G0WZV8_9STRA|nr:hypothetical protein Ae201684_009956 [Aphanomyces euteiches]KAH9095849.1 hypothetical protein Ae201684P_010060 [Aphanomyces euteiches]